MASYITRVELHNASERDYINLHEAMRQQGFSRTITSDQGVVYNLPPAEYYFYGTISRLDVLERAKRAATLTRREAEIVVVEYVGCSWSGLAASR
jgi:hypothetical protein